MNHIFAILIAAFLCFSCQSEKTAIETDGSIPSTAEPARLQQPASPEDAPCEVELTPKTATCRTTFRLIARGFDPADARIEWLVNGTPYTMPVPDRFSGTEAGKGAVVQAKVFVRDQEVLSEAVQIMNAPPEIVRAALLPMAQRPGEALSVDAQGEDMDGDEVSLLYEWTMNDQPAGEGAGITVSLKRGDKVSVKITPFDGEDYGAPVVLRREISNLPPVISDNKKFTFDGAVYTYQVKAADPDEDALVYSLKSAPNGMSVDESTGLIKWPVPPEFKGDAQATAIVDDGHGGTARYEIKVTIK